MNYDPKKLFALARFGIEKEYGDAFQPVPNLEEKYLENRACFVTITLNNQLRGCIGSLVPHQSLRDDVVSNAHSAAFKDHRFTPLTEEEYKQVTLEISILTVPEPVIFKDRDDLESLIEPGKDGIVLSCNGRRATFLPHVWDSLPKFDVFFSQLFKKAGLGPLLDFSNASIQRYRVEKYDE